MLAAGFSVTSESQTAGDVLGPGDGKAVVSDEIQETAGGFLPDDAGVGGHNPVVGVFTGVDISHTQNGEPHVQTKVGWGGIGNFLSSLWF